jgi:Ca2+-binding EF-hand superfamily protein
MFGDSTTSLGATLPHAKTRANLDSKLKQTFSEPLLLHQSGVPARHHPHPNEAAANRWPKPGWTTGGVIDPADLRRHANDFGYRQLRFKPISKEAKEAPEMTLEEVRTFLTKRYGSLSKAFSVMDFFTDGTISAVEWREGVYNALSSSYGTDLAKYRMAICPRRLFNERMQKLFVEMDEDANGLIDFAEFTRAYLAPEETSRAFTLRREIEKSAHAQEKKVAKDRKLTIAKIKELPEQRDDMSVLKDFAMHLLRSFKDVNEAFAALDLDGNGQLSLAEFKDGARRIKYRGNYAEVFKLLDHSNTGTINKTELRHLRMLPAEAKKAGTLCTFTKKNVQSAIRIRSPIQNPPKHCAGLTLPSSDVVRPLGQNTHTAAGFHTFGRAPTGRLDDLAHPEEYPGTDPDKFCQEHGPGFVDKGPEYFPYIGAAEHPIRGNKWKFGGTWSNHIERFGPVIPSKQGNSDRELSAASYSTHEGWKPKDGFKINNTGGVSWSRTSGRTGISSLALRTW